MNLICCQIHLLKMAFQRLLQHTQKQKRNKKRGAENVDTHPTDRTNKNVDGIRNVSFYSLSFGWLGSHRWISRWFFFVSLRYERKMWNVFAPLFLISFNRDYGFVYARTISSTFCSFAFLFSYFIIYYYCMLLYSHLFLFPPHFELFMIRWYFSHSMLHTVYVHGVIHINS